MKTLVINLDKSKDRLELFKKRFRLPFERVSAVDGMKDCFYTDDVQFDKVMQRIPKIVVNGDRKFVNNARLCRKQMCLSLTEIGCALSHRYLYEKLAMSDSENRVLILEDDAVPLVGTEELQEYLGNLPEEFDIIHLGFSEWFPFTLTEQVNSHYSKIERKFFNGTFSYIISKSGAKKLLVLLSNSLNLTADDTISSAFIDNCINVFVPKKPLFYVDPSIKTTII